MASSFSKLVEIAAPPLAHQLPVPTAGNSSPIDRQLFELLAQINGFVAFESAFHLYPSSPDDPLSLENWNKPGLWRFEYGDLISPDAHFFAQDIFGNQFAIHQDAINHFDAETAAFRPLTPSFGEFIAKLLTDYRNMAGFDAAHAWQTRHGALTYGKCLAPKIPFVLGGSADLSNLYAADQIELMRFRGSLARQIRNLPDGTKVGVIVT